mgnify:CR=1 FL=1
MEMLTERRAWWSRPENRYHNLTDSLAYPFEGIEGLFIGRDVLEIGPGHGRQCRRLVDVAKSYSVCDIVPMDEPAFDGLQKFVIEDYSVDMGADFDVIHFWYVLHHVPISELSPFFEFVSRHLLKGGHAMFNTPILHPNGTHYAGDGLATTWIDRDAVLQNLGQLDVVMEQHQNVGSSGILFVVRKGR